MWSSGLSRWWIYSLACPSPPENPYWCSNLPLWFLPLFFFQEFSNRSIGIRVPKNPSTNHIGSVNTGHIMELATYLLISQPELLSLIVTVPTVRRSNPALRRNIGDVGGATKKPAAMRQRMDEEMTISACYFCTREAGKSCKPVVAVNLRNSSGLIPKLNSHEEGGVLMLQTWGGIIVQYMGIYVHCRRRVRINAADA